MAATAKTCQGSGEPFVRAGTPAGRWVLLAAILGSGIAILDGSVVNVALPAIGADLDAEMSQLQWVVNAYLLTLASLILVGGGLGDRWGRRRVFLVGIAWFGAASLLCAVAQTADQLVLARLAQGVGGALLTPGSLAIIQASFPPQDRGRAIGQWAGLGGVAAAVGPVLGGWVVEVSTWRWIFLVNVPIAAAIVYVGVRHVPESLDPDAPRGYDVTGSALGVLGLGGITSP
jgi:MFS family permease